MEARATLRGPGVSKSGGVVVLVLVAVGLVAMAGYVAKGFSSTPGSSGHRLPAAQGAVVDSAVQANRLPGWIYQEISPKAAPRLFQDDIVRNARPVAPAYLPGYIVEGITPKTAPRLLQDDIVRYAKPSQTAILPSWLLDEIGPRTIAPRILQDDIVRSATPATPAISVDLAPRGDW